MRLASNSKLPALVLACAIGGSLACAKPAPDTDGSSAQAKGLALGKWHTNQLHCSRGDCADWYRVDLGDHGDLLV